MDFGIDYCVVLVLSVLTRFLVSWHP